MEVIMTLQSKLLILLGSFSAMAQSDLEAFVDAFNKSECVAEALSDETISDPQDFLDESIADAYGNADSYRGVEKNIELEAVS